MLGTVCTAVAYLIFFTIIARAGAGYAALVTYLVPPVALGYGAIFLDEGVGAAALVGLVLILAGVTLGTRRGRSRGVRGGRGARVTTVETETIGEAWLETARRDPARRRRRRVRRRAHEGARTRHGPGLGARSGRRDDRAARGSGVARLDAPQLHGAGRRRRSSAARARYARGSATTAGATRSRGCRAARGSRVPLGCDHDVRAAHRHDVRPVHLPARLLARVGGALDLVVYAHSLDFGKKAYGNLVELARLQHEVAGAVGCPVGTLVVHAKSAHVYEPELALMAELAA